MSERLARAIMRYRVLIILVVLTITLFFAYQMKNIRLYQNLTEIALRNHLRIRGFPSGAGEGGVGLSGTVLAGKQFLKKGLTMLVISLKRRRFCRGIRKIIEQAVSKACLG